jgi:hypothetical protein
VITEMVRANAHMPNVRSSVRSTGRPMPDNGAEGRAIDEVRARGRASEGLLSWQAPSLSTILLLAVSALSALTGYEITCTFRRVKTRWPWQRPQVNHFVQCPHFASSYNYEELLLQRLYCKSRVEMFYTRSPAPDLHTVANS